MTTQLLMDRAYAALCDTLGEPKGWEQIAPARKFVPLAIQRKEQELQDAIDTLNLAAEINEQGRTDASVENLGDAAELVSVIGKELEVLREMWYQHPDAFEEE